VVVASAVHRMLDTLRISSVRSAPAVGRKMTRDVR
jgi:hypothetical protein